MAQTFLEVKILRHGTQAFILEAFFEADELASM